MRKTFRPDIKVKKYINCSKFTTSLSISKPTGHLKIVRKRVVTYTLKSKNSKIKFTYQVYTDLAFKHRLRTMCGAVQAVPPPTHPSPPIAPTSGLPRPMPNTQISTILRHSNIRLHWDCRGRSYDGSQNWWCGCRRGNVCILRLVHVVQGQVDFVCSFTVTVWEPRLQKLCKRLEFLLRVRLTGFAAQRAEAVVVWEGSHTQQTETVAAGEDRGPGKQLQTDRALVALLADVICECNVKPPHVVLAQLGRLISTHAPQSFIQLFNGCPLLCCRQHAPSLSLGHQPSQCDVVHHQRLRPSIHPRVGVAGGAQHKRIDEHVAGRKVTHNRVCLHISFNQCRILCLPLIQQGPQMLPRLELAAVKGVQKPYNGLLVQHKPEKLGYFAESFFHLRLGGFCCGERVRNSVLQHFGEKSDRGARIGGSDVEGRDPILLRAVLLSLLFCPHHPPTHHINHPLHQTTRFQHYRPTQECKLFLRGRIDQSPHDACKTYRPHCLLKLNDWLGSTQSLPTISHRNDLNPGDFRDFPNLKSGHAHHKLCLLVEISVFVVVNQTASLLVCRVGFVAQHQLTNGVQVPGVVGKAMGCTVVHKLHRRKERIQLVVAHVTNPFHETYNLRFHHRPHAECLRQLRVGEIQRCHKSHLHTEIMAESRHQLDSTLQDITVCQTDNIGCFVKPHMGWLEHLGLTGRATAAAAAALIVTNWVSVDDNAPYITEPVGQLCPEALTRTVVFFLFQAGVEVAVNSLEP
eukprot:comp22620_c2_seq1/m.34749 comp22620_c2_seq1/g.34749  ORF comp22620_c2_seq1/g.34749 comp22620_c2_seq1/m.34749 type:complete len:744 (+) comp22620_c2_seq1:77-2308(+)